MSDSLSASIEALGLNPTDDSSDLSLTLAALEASSSPSAADVLDELISLSAIYEPPEDGTPSLSTYTSPLSGPSEDGTVRVLLRTALPSPHERIQLGLIITLPSDYPQTSAPLIQLENRFLGPEPVPASLWAQVLRTFLHEPSLPLPVAGLAEEEDGVQWVGECCLYEGVEKVREVCGKWIAGREGERERGERRREEMARGSQVHSIQQGEAHKREEKEEQRREERKVEFVPCPAITTTDALVDRKSVFVGHAARVRSLQEVEAVKMSLLSNPKISRATHPCICAYRLITADGVLHADNDDDGEDAAGSRLAHLLVLLGLQDVIVVVTRWYGGIHLSTDRFKDINAVAREALELGGFLEEPEDGKKGGGKGGKSSNNNKPKKR